MNTMLVANLDGEKIIPAKVFVRFTANIGNELHELAVTEVDQSVAPKLTHVATGAGMVNVHSTDVAVGRFDWETIGRITLQKLIDAKGAARIAAAIRKQELKNGKSD